MSSLLFLTHPSTQKLTQVCDEHHLHPIILSGLIHNNSHPKYHTLDGHLFLAINIPVYDEQSQLFQTTEVDIVVNKDILLITSQYEIPWISQTFLSLHKLPNSFAWFTMLIDQIYDHTLAILDQIENTIGNIRDGLFSSKSWKSDILEDLLIIKLNINTFTHNFEPQEKILINVRQFALQTLWITQTYHAYDDAVAKLTKVVYQIRHLSDDVESLTDTYDSLINAHNNNLTTTLTIMASIFIPLTFIVGVFGMNFDNIPLTKHTIGFSALIVIMMMVGIGQILYFKWKKRF